MSVERLIVVVCFRVSARKENVASGSAVIFGYRTVVSMDVERVTDDVHVIYGFGGNVGVLRTGRGAVVVDTMSYRFQGRQILERKITKKPVD